MLDESKIFFHRLFPFGRFQGLAAEEFRIRKSSRPLAGLPPLRDDLQKSVRALPLEVTFQTVLFVFNL